MGYLIDADYNRLMQDISLQQLISNDISLKSRAELTSLTEIKSYLSSKYDVDREFTDTTIYNPSATYKALNRVYITAAFYNETITYALKDMVQKGGKIYKCTTAVTIPEAFTIGKWQLLGTLNDIFYAQLPKPEFNVLTGNYQLNDQVFWKEKIYTAKIATRHISHETAIQYQNTKAIPAYNVFPDDPLSGAEYWGAGVAYSVPQDSLLSATYFTPGDNRNQQMVSNVLDCTIYNLYSRITPGIVPELRIYRYNSVKSWLNNVAKGDEIVADLLKLQPQSGIEQPGSRIRWGSSIRKINEY